MGTTLDLTLRLQPNITDLKVLNLGAGYCSSPVSCQIVDLPFEKLVNVEIWPETFAKLEHIVFGAFVVENVMDDVLAYVLRYFEKDLFDTVLLIDVLEHLGRHTAEVLLSECRRIAKRVVIFLPLGLCPQDALEGNPYQVHQSTWYATDFPGANVEVIKGQHIQYSPPVDAAWVIYDKG